MRHPLTLAALWQATVIYNHRVDLIRAKTVVLLVGCVFTVGLAQTAGEDAYNHFLQTSEVYRQEITGLIELLKKDLATRRERLQIYQDAYRDGIVSRHEMERVRVELETVQKKFDEQAQLLMTADHAMAEVAMEYQQMVVTAERERLALPLRFVGDQPWKLEQSGALAEYYLQTFGTALPVSAYGQTPTHDVLGFDHRERLDLAIHPASREGQAVMAYLREIGVSFIAFGNAVAGSATGAHIHVGPPSPRVLTNRAR